MGGAWHCRDPACLRDRGGRPRALRRIPRVRPSPGHRPDGVPGAGGRTGRGTGHAPARKRYQRRQRRRNCPFGIRARPIDHPGHLQGRFGPAQGPADRGRGTCQGVRSVAEQRRDTRAFAADLLDHGSHQDRAGERPARPAPIEGARRMDDQAAPARNARGGGSGDLRLGRIALRSAGTPRSADRPANFIGRRVGGGFGSDHDARWRVCRDGQPAHSRAADQRAHRCGSLGQRADRQRRRAGDPLGRSRGYRAGRRTADRRGADHGAARCIGVAVQPVRRQHARCHARCRGHDRRSAAFARFAGRQNISRASPACQLHRDRAARHVDRFGGGSGDDRVHPGRLPARCKGGADRLPRDSAFAACSPDRARPARSDNQHDDARRAHGRTRRGR